jgi:PLP dependent protein
VAASTDAHRSAELVSALAAVRGRLTDAAAGVGRDPQSVTLIAVTKTFPASDLSILMSLGVRDLGESRDQEARAKLREYRMMHRDEEFNPEHKPRVHFVGRLQTNKCRSVAGYAYCVHTVDRPQVAAALADGVQHATREGLAITEVRGQRLPVFLQVSLDGDPKRGGTPIDGVAALADTIAGTAELALLGVMAVPPLGADPDDAFARLGEVSRRLCDSHPGAGAISAGMSDDFEAAVRNGATHVRIGSALLGRRDVTFS